MTRMADTRTPARLSALVAALAAACACAGPAQAASAVSDQYLSAPMPLVQAKATAAAAATSKATPSAAPQASATGPASAAGARPVPAQRALRPLTVTRTGDAGTTLVDAPLAAASSDPPPLVALAALGLLAVGFVLAAVGRARARAAAP